MVEERGQVLFHLDAVVVHLGHGEDAHLALPPNLSSTNTTADIRVHYCSIILCRLYVVCINLVLYDVSCIGKSGYLLKLCKLTTKLY